MVHRNNAELMCQSQPTTVMKIAEDNQILPPPDKELLQSTSHKTTIITGIITMMAICPNKW